jgi:hypothetical protein
MKLPWEIAGMSQFDYSKLPYGQKKPFIKLAHGMTDKQIEAERKERQRKEDDFLAAMPPEFHHMEHGRLLWMWRQHVAQTETMIYNNALPPSAANLMGL